MIKALSHTLWFVAVGAIGFGLLGVFGDLWLEAQYPGAVKPASVWSFVIGYFFGILPALLCGSVDYLLSNRPYRTLAATTLAFCTGVLMSFDFVTDRLLVVAMGLAVAAPIWLCSWLLNMKRNRGVMSEG